MLYRKEISSLTGYDTYQRGITLYQQNKVSDLEVENLQDGVIVRSKVKGRVWDSYSVELILKHESGNDSPLAIIDYGCECPAANSWGGLCKHCVAVALVYSDQTKQERAATQFEKASRKSSGDLEDVFQRYASTGRNLEASILPGQMKVQLFFDMEMDYRSHRHLVHVELKAGKDRLYVVKSIPAFLHSIIHGTAYSYGKNLTVYHSFGMFDEVSERILHVLAGAVREKVDALDTSAVYWESGSPMRTLPLTDAQALALFQLQAESNGTVIFQNAECRLVQGNPPISLKFQRNPQMGGADLLVPGILRVCAEPNGVYLFDGALYCTTPEFELRALPFLHAIHATGKADMFGKTFLSEKDYTRFCATVLPQLKSVMRVEFGDVDFEDYLPKDAVFHFYISKGDDGSVLLRPEVCYGDAAYSLLVTNREYRRLEQEQPVSMLCHQYFPHEVSEDTLSAIGDDEIFGLVDSGLDALRQQGEVYIEDSLRSMRWKNPGNVSIGVSLKGNLIDINVEAAGLNPKEINQILSAYRLRKRYYRLKSGEFLSLTEGGLSSAAELTEGLDVMLDDQGHAQTDAYRAQYINRIVENDDNGISVTRNADFKQQIRTLKNYRDGDYELPEGLRANLRGYQKAGYRWLSALSELGLGGILADDMGLGKTLQMLSYFLSVGGKLLVVCPASLIYNWENESHRFVPSLETHIVRGTPTQRKEALSAERGLLITSYEQLRRDLEMYKDVEFDCCVLDEAQYIRNAATKAAKAVKMVRATHRFALTGTPIENRLSDLWSIFDFLMPGYLFKYSDFKSRIEQKAIEGDEKASQRLVQMTAPFILRRKKQDVLKELPDKVEQVLYLEMTPEQRKLYDAQAQALQLSLLNTGESEFAHQKIQYLAALTRLRQLCCTPELYLENYDGGAAKVEACMELIKESMDAGHKTLVFSQFTTMLEHLVAAATKNGIPSLYLSGKDSSEKRRDMVDEFQNGSVPVFFISLKAGGTGLNLTAADRVIHFDPWWNGAAEDQATDRTHRIGQKNTVFVTKLVCKDSVEERIIDLQNRKRGLSDMVVDQESLQSGALNREELLYLLEGRAAEG